MRDLGNGRFLIKPDKRGRVSLGNLATVDRYWVDVKPGGTIVLSPAPTSSTPAATPARRD